MIMSIFHLDATVQSGHCEIILIVNSSSSQDLPRGGNDGSLLRL